MSVTFLELHVVQNSLLSFNRVPSINRLRHILLKFSVEKISTERFLRASAYSPKAVDKVRLVLERLAYLQYLFNARMMNAHLQYIFNTRL